MFVVVILLVCTQQKQQPMNTALIDLIRIIACFVFSGTIAIAIVLFAPIVSSFFNLLFKKISPQAQEETIKARIRFALVLFNAFCACLVIDIFVMIAARF